VTVKSWFGITGALLALGVFLCGWQFTEAAEPAPAPAKVEAVAPASSNVRITFTTVPSQKAMVYWGKKRLGVIAPRQPLIIERPRDSGPLDVIVRAAGYLPVETRAYTFADSKVAVKLTPPDQKKTLLGYREAPPDAGAPSTNPEARGPDAGAVR
jgi:hypothetical protein